MTDDLSALPEDVREAWQRIVADEQCPGDFECVQAELRRLTAMEHAWKQWIKDGMRVKFPQPEPPK